MDSLAALYILFHSPNATHPLSSVKASAVASAPFGLDQNVQARLAHSLLLSQNR